MLYNLLRGYEITRGFAPLTNEGRLNANLFAGIRPWRNFDSAITQIIRITRRLEDVNHPSQYTRKNAREQLEYLMRPFGDTLSPAALLEIAKLLYEYMGGESFPDIEIQPWEDIKEPKKRKSIAETVKAMRAA